MSETAFDSNGYLRKLVAGELVIATCAYRKYRPEFGVPVATSVGTPGGRSPWRHERALEQCRGLTPYGIFKNPAYADFAKAERAYVDRLRKDEDKVLAQLWLLHERFGGEPLVILCWEPNPAECHRSWAADWLGGHGVRVLEAPAHLLANEPAPTMVDDGQQRLFD